MTRLLLSVVAILATGATVPAADPPTAAERARLLKIHGGNTESEAAVARGLAWLAAQQRKDGSWEFDGTSKDQVAATGMALLPFLAAGETHKGAKKYQKTVALGVDWLTGKLGSGRSFGTNNMYAHALATIALCDAGRITKDDQVRAKAALAVEYIVNAQGKNGSWGYTGPNPSEGDTSIVGWQVQALDAALRAGVPVGDLKVYPRADEFLVSVSTGDGAKYGYREKGASQTLTPSALLSRLLMGTLKRSDPAVVNGVKFLREFPPQKGYFDMYYYYYATRVMYLHGDGAWHTFWNPKMRDLLVDLQVKGDDDTKGSWDKDQGFIGSSCGRLGTTALAVLTLEVYYRYPPPTLPKGFEVPEKR